MTPEQEAHLQSIKDQFLALVDPKFRKGAEEHSGDLQEVKPLVLVDYAIEEAIDQVVYLLTLRSKLEYSEENQ